MSMNFWFIFSFLARSTDRTCKEMRFCRSNAVFRSLEWSINPNLMKFENNEFSTPLILNESQTENTLHIFKIPKSGFHIKVHPKSDLERYRFNITHDNILINETIYSSHKSISFKKNATHATIISKNTSLVIHLKPFKITVFDHFNGLDREVMQINQNQQLFIEDGSPAEDEEWEGEIETFPHGQTAIKIDFSFPNGSFLTGLAEGTNPANLMDTESEPLRRYALDGYSKYGSLPLITAHHPEYSTSNPTVFMMNPSDSWFHIKTTTGSDFNRSVHAIHEGGFIDFVIFTGEMKDVIRQYSELTGVAKMPPAFAFGYQQSKWGYTSQDLVEEVIHNLTENGFPYDVIWLDIDHLANRAPFLINTTSYPDLPGFFKRLESEGRYAIRITDPHMPVDVKPHRQYEEALQRDYFVKYKGAPAVADCWPGRSSWPDFFRAEVREWWSQQFPLNESDGWPENVFLWNDMNEIAAWGQLEGTLPKDALYDGIETREAHSAYGTMMISATFEGLMKRSKHRPFILTRSFFSGAQKYAWQWSGDNFARWEHLQYSLDMMVVSGLAAYPFTGSDVGGFNENPNAEMLARWYQAGSLTQCLFREHCNIEQPFREPYLFKETNPEEYEAMKEAVLDRYRLFSLWYTAAYEHIQTTNPVVAPLWLEFPEERVMHEVRFQLLIGNRLMACPVVHQGAKTLRVEKPPGRWFDWKTGAELKESGEINVTIKDAPAYLRGGSILPIYDPSDTIPRTVEGNITILVAFDENMKAEGRMFMDDLKTFAFEEGEEAIVSFEASSDHFATQINGKSAYAKGTITGIKFYGCAKKDLKIPFPKGATVSEDENGVFVSNLNLSISKEIDFALVPPSAIAGMAIAGIAALVSIAIVIAFAILGGKGNAEKSEADINKQSLL